MSSLPAGTLAPAGGVLAIRMACAVAQAGTTARPSSVAITMRQIGKTAAPVRARLYRLSVGGTQIPPDFTNESPTAGPSCRLSLVSHDHHALDGQRRVSACEQRQLFFVLRYSGDVLRDDRGRGRSARRPGTLRGGRGDVPISQFGSVSGPHRGGNPGGADRREFGALRDRRVPQR